jgi:hypothetical protein
LINPSRLERDTTFFAFKKSLLAKLAAPAMSVIVFLEVSRWSLGTINHYRRSKINHSDFVPEEEKKRRGRRPSLILRVRVRFSVYLRRGPEFVFVFLKSALRSETCSTDLGQLVSVRLG